MHRPRLLRLSNVRRAQLSPLLRTGRLFMAAGGWHAGWQVVSWPPSPAEALACARGCACVPSSNSTRQLCGLHLLLQRADVEVLEHALVHGAVSAL